MSGISGIGSSGSSSSLYGSSGSSSTLNLNPSTTSSTLPNGGLSSVGESLLTTGQAPTAASSATSASSSTSNSLSSYQKEYLNLQQYDDQELLYASFLSPEAGLANFDSVMQQAAALLGTPGDPGPALQVGSSTSGSTTSGTSTTGTSTSGTSATGTSSTSTSSSALSNLPSVQSILAASDDEAEQTLQAYANAPVGSSIIDYQA